MFRSKTVFVVGAGASKEFGLPIGSELATQIGSHLKLEVDRFGNFLGGEYELYEACQRAANRDQKEVREYLRACKAISDALPTAVSIDTYLEVHEGDKEIEVCGKLGIVHSILRAERASHLRAQAEDDSAPPLFTNGPVLQSWLALFVKMVQVGITKHNVERALENVTFVIFNYDRCVEHYLFHWFQLFYRIDASVAAQILSRARFYHPYGVAGDLPWQSRSGDGVPFGANLGADRLLNVATRIRTYSEQVEDRATQDHIHNAIADASRLVFLGFGFGEQKFLTLPIASKMRRVFGTAYKVSAANQDEFKMRVVNMLLNGSVDVVLEQVESAKLLGDYDSLFVK